MGLSSGSPYWQYLRWICSNASQCILTLKCFRLTVQFLANDLFEPYSDSDIAACSMYVSMPSTMHTLLNVWYGHC